MVSRHNFLHLPALHHLIDLIHRKQHKQEDDDAEYQHDGIGSFRIGNGIFSRIGWEISDFHQVAPFVFTGLRGCFSIVGATGGPILVFKGDNIGKT